jgi:hypothetical protein
MNNENIISNKFGHNLETVFSYNKLVPLLLSVTFYQR